MSKYFTMLFALLITSLYSQGKANVVVDSLNVSNSQISGYYNCFDLFLGIGSTSGACIGIGFKPARQYRLEFAYGKKLGIFLYGGEPYDIYTAGMGVTLYSLSQYTELSVSVLGSFSYYRGDGYNEFALSPLIGLHSVSKSGVFFFVRFGYFAIIHVHNTSTFYSIGNQRIFPNIDVCVGLSFFEKGN